MEKIPTKPSTLTGFSLEQSKLIQAERQGNIVLEKHFVIKNYREYGPSYALLELVVDLELDKMIYSRISEKWVQDAFAMIIGKVVYTGSKLSLKKWHRTAIYG